MNKMTTQAQQQLTGSFWGALAQPPALAIPQQPPTYYSGSRRDRRSALGIVLTQHVGQPVKDWKIVQDRGCDVIVVSFDYWTLPDPMMPITNYDFGDLYRNTWRAMAKRMTEWSPRLTYNAQARWYSDLRQQIATMTDIVATVGWLSLTGTKLHKLALEWAAANPHRFVVQPPAAVPVNPSLDELDAALLAGRISYAEYNQFRWVRGK